jgi:hypothetical protein
LALYLTAKAKRAIAWLGGRGGEDAHIQYTRTETWKRFHWHEFEFARCLHDLVWTVPIRFTFVIIGVL